MLGNLWDYSVLNQRQIERLKNWAILKQDEGFHGRTNKPDDSCYAFWIGATLSVIFLFLFFSLCYNKKNEQIHIRVYKANFISYSEF